MASMMKEIIARHNQVATAKRERHINRMVTNWDESKHPRNPVGTAMGGRFKSVGGSAEAGAMDRQQRLANLANRRKLKKEGGFTYQPRVNLQPVKGFAVSPYASCSFSKPLTDISPTDFVKYTRRNRDLLSNPDHYLGAWGYRGKVFLDVSIVKKTRVQAIKLVFLIWRTNAKLLPTSMQRLEVWHE
jgi:hypothetical protein